MRESFIRPTHGGVWDAAVVGAGPAGAVCARELALSGHRVALLEKHPWPRYKTCGGGLIGRATTHLADDLEPVIERRTLSAVLSMADLGTSFTVTRDRPVVSMTMRSDLDALLVRRAIDAGATFESEALLTGLDRNSGGWRIGLGSHGLTARCVVAADGATGPVAQLAGWSGHRHLVPALESEIEVDQETFLRFDAAARFDFGLVPDGYAWIFPKAGHLSIGCLSFRSRRPHLRQQLERYLEILGIRPLSREDHGFVIPVAPRAPTLARDGVLLTGDAAGLADPVTCEGISNAMISGRLAAQAITESPGDRASTIYQASLRSSLLAELKVARFLARLLYLRPGLRRFVFRRLGSPLSEAMTALISGELNYRDLVSSPGRLWRGALGLTRPAV